MNQDNVTIMHMLLREHAIVGGIAFTQKYDQSEQLAILQQKVQENTDRLTDMIGRIKGDDKKDTFRRLWQRHIDLLMQYADAQRGGNEDQKNQLRQDLDKSVDELSNFLKSEKVSKNELQQLLRVHIDQEQSVIELYASGDFKGAMRVLIEGGRHADMMADTILRSGNWR